jgi:MFS family permease
MSSPNDSESENSPDDSEELRSTGLSKTSSGHVKWRKGHPELPANWNTKQKAWHTTLIIGVEFWTTLISTTGPAAAEKAEEEYKIGTVLMLFVFSFLYNFGNATGSLVLPPCSESFGRKKQYIYSCVAFAIACLLISEVPHPAGPAVGRLASGFAASIPSIVVVGSLVDMYDVHERVWMLLLWINAGTLGLVGGPIYGSYIAEYVGW